MLYPVPWGRVRLLPSCGRMRVSALPALPLGNRIENALPPGIVAGLNDDDAKAMRFALHPDAVRIIDVQINTECGRKFRG